MNSKYRQCKQFCKNPTNLSNCLTASSRFRSEVRCSQFLLSFLLFCVVDVLEFRVAFHGLCLLAPVSVESVGAAAVAGVDVEATGSSGNAVVASSIIACASKVNLQTSRMHP